MHFDIVRTVILYKAVFQHEPQGHSCSSSIIVQKSEFFFSCLVLTIVKVPLRKEVTSFCFCGNSQKANSSRLLVLYSSQEYISKKMCLLRKTLCAQTKSSWIKTRMKGRIKVSWIDRVRHIHFFFFIQTSNFLRVLCICIYFVITFYF